MANRGSDSYASTQTSMRNTSIRPWTRSQPEVSGADHALPGHPVPMASHSPLGVETNPRSTTADGSKGLHSSAHDPRPLSSQRTKGLWEKRVDLNHLVTDLVGTEYLLALVRRDDPGPDRSVE